MTALRHCGSMVLCDYVSNVLWDCCLTILWYYCINWVM